MLVEGDGNSITYTISNCSTVKFWSAEEIPISTLCKLYIFISGIVRINLNVDPKFT